MIIGLCRCGAFFVKQHGWISGVSLDQSVYLLKPDQYPEQCHLCQGSGSNKSLRSLPDGVLLFLTQNFIVPPQPETQHNNYKVMAKAA